jgi:deazaflavin-dependent oxidoreductase (nitroreductase family)
MTDTAEMLAWNDAIIGDMRSHGGTVTQGPMAGAALLILTTVGAKSGDVRATPLAYTRDGDRLVVVASNRGYHTHPAWYANLLHQPEVRVEVGGEAFPARAAIAAGDERRRLYDAHAAVMPTFAQYEQMTDREIPVVTLKRIADA